MRLLLIALAGLALAGPATASAAPKTCPPKKGTLAKNALSRVWHQGASLYGCTTVYTHKPKAKRLGPWTPGTKVALSGDDVAWTTTVMRDAGKVDRLWAANIDEGKRWMAGKRLVPAAGEQPEREARIARLIAASTSVAWTTTSAEVGFALRSPESEPEAIGTLPAPLQPDGQRLLVGQFPDADPVALTTSLKLEVGDGEGDECGGSNPYELRFQAGGAPSGVRWWGGWTSTNCG
jgi:hypothetical protein